MNVETTAEIPDSLKSYPSFDLLWGGKLWRRFEGNVTAAAIIKLFEEKERENPR